MNKLCDIIQIQKCLLKKKVFHIETIILYIYLFNVVRIIDMVLLFIFYILYFQKTSPSKNQ